MSADVDVAKAWLTTWNRSESLAKDVPGGIASDRLAESRPLAALPERTMPYAELQVRPARKKDYVSGGQYIDYRRVELLLWGVGKEKLGQVVSAIHAVYDSQPGQPSALDFSFSPQVVGHLRTVPLDDTEAPDETKKQGEDVRKVVIPFEVWTQRSAG